MKPIVIFIFAFMSVIDQASGFADDYDFDYDFKKRVSHVTGFSLV